MRCVFSTKLCPSCNLPTRAASLPARPLPSSIRTSRIPRLIYVKSTNLSKVWQCVLFLFSRNTDDRVHTVHHRCLAKPDHPNGLFKGTRNQARNLEVCQGSRIVCLFVSDYSKDCVSKCTRKTSSTKTVWLKFKVRIFDPTHNEVLLIVL